MHSGYKPYKCHSCSYRSYKIYNIQAYKNKTHGKKSRLEEMVIDKDGLENKDGTDNHAEQKIDNPTRTFFDDENIY